MSRLVRRSDSMSLTVAAPVLRLGFAHSLRQGSRKFQLVELRVPVHEAAVAGREELISSLDAVTRHNALAEAFAKIARALASSDPEAEARPMARERSERRGGEKAVTNAAVQAPPPMMAEPVRNTNFEPKGLVGLGYGIAMKATSTVDSPHPVPPLPKPGALRSLPTPDPSTAPSSMALSQVETPPLSMPMLSPGVSRSGVVARASAADLWASEEANGSGDAVMVDAAPASGPSSSAQILPLPSPIPPPTSTSAPSSASRAAFDLPAPPMQMQRSASMDGPPPMHPDRLRALSSLPSKPRQSAPPSTSFAGTSANSLPVVKRYFSEASLPAKPPSAASVLPVKPPVPVVLPAKPHDVEKPWHGPSPAASPPRGPRSWVSPTSEAPPSLGIQIRGRKISPQSPVGLQIRGRARAQVRLRSGSRSV